MVGRPDMYGQAAKKFLQLLPSSSITAEKLFLESIKNQASVSQPLSFPDTPNRVNSPPPPPPLLTSSPLHTSQLERPKPVHLSVPTAQGNGASTSKNPFDESLPSHTPPRSRSGSNGSSTGSLVSISSAASGGQALHNHTSTATTASKSELLQFEYIPPLVSYMRNLLAARTAIARCSARCRNWTNRYDRCLEEAGEKPSSGRRGGEAAKSSEMEDVEIRNDVSTQSEREDERSLAKLSEFRTRSVTVSSSYRLPLARTKEIGGSGSRVARIQGLEEGVAERNVTRSLKQSPRLSRRLEESRFEDRTGLLLKVLMDKLSEMLSLSPAVNILLTRVVSRLAHYPQPLLRSLLLNHQLVLRPGVPNLYYVREHTHHAQHCTCIIIHVGVCMYMYMYMLMICTQFIISATYTVIHVHVHM